MKDRVYSLYDPNVVTIISRDILEEELSEQKSGLVDQNGKLDDFIFGLLREKIREDILWFLADAYSDLEDMLERIEENRDRRIAHKKQKNVNYAS
jgi:hypothetical protein